MINERDDELAVRSCFVDQKFHQVTFKVDVRLTISKQKGYDEKGVIIIDHTDFIQKMGASVFVYVYESIKKVCNGRLVFSGQGLHHFIDIEFVDLFCIGVCHIFKTRMIDMPIRHAGICVGSLAITAAMTAVWSGIYNGICEILD